MAILARRGRDPAHQRGDFTERPDSARADAAHPVESSDAALVGRAQRDPIAFAPLYQRYLTPIYRYCYRQTSDPDAATDLTAHIFTRALEALPRFQSRASTQPERRTKGNRSSSTFRSWLFAIAHNAIIDHRRRMQPTQSLDPVRHERPDPGESLEAHAIHQDELDRLIAMLDQIPENHRQIVELRLAGLTTGEIAQALGLSRAAVKSAQTRAYSRLRISSNRPTTTNRILISDAHPDLHRPPSGSQPNDPHATTVRPQRQILDRRLPGFRP